MSQQRKPICEIGDLVRCFYDFNMYFCGTYPGDTFYDSYYCGIVINFRTAENDYPFYGYYGPWYEVLCFDGLTRYFCEWEIILL